jgi:hypothetical protein
VDGETRVALRFRLSVYASVWGLRINLIWICVVNGAL